MGHDLDVDATLFGGLVHLRHQQTGGHPSRTKQENLHSSTSFLKSILKIFGSVKHHLFIGIYYIYYYISLANMCKVLFCFTKNRPYNSYLPFDIIVINCRLGRGILWQKLWPSVEVLAIHQNWWKG